MKYVKMSTLIEHQILAIAVLSAIWRYYFIFDWTIIATISSTIISIFALYFCYVVEQKWTAWNNDKPNFWFHQLRNVNRQPQALGLWCPVVEIFLACVLTLSYQRYGNIFPMIILIMINLPLITRFVSHMLLRRLKSASLVSDLFSTIVNLCLLQSFFNISLLLACLLSILPSLWNTFLTPKLMISAAKSFTLGEYQLIYSTTALTLVSSVRLLCTSTVKDTNFDAIFVLLAWSFIFCIIFIILCFAFGILRKSTAVFCLVLFIMVLTAYLFCLFISGLDLLSWLADFFVFGSNRDLLYRRWIIVIFWLLCVACTVNFAVVCWTLPRLGTVHRKFFHLTISLVAITGLLYDRPLTILATVLMFEGFLILEVMRLCDVEPIGKPLREIYAKFIDHQDQGPLVLTPIYLLIGCFVPIWMDIPIADIGLRHFAGVISVGVGDAAAAIGGTYLGRTPWKTTPNGRKTIEGTICGFFAQLITLISVSNLIGPSGFMDLESIVWIIWSCLLISLLETFSAQVDNLVLPLFAFLLFLV